jgi:short-subunit dehydrogenase
MCSIVVAQKIVEAVENKKRDVILSLRSKIVNHINYWAPAFLDIILKRKAMSGYKRDSD